MWAATLLTLPAEHGQSTPLRGDRPCHTEFADAAAFPCRDQACGQVEGLPPEHVELRRMLSVRVSAEWVNKPTSAVVGGLSTMVVMQTLSTGFRSFLETCNE